MTNIDRNIELAAQGDVDAFEELYRMHHRRVYSQCLRMTRSIPEAEDVTQEVFIQLFRKLKTFRGESLFTTWLHRLTTNEVLMHFRRIAARPDRAAEDAETLGNRLVGTAARNATSLIDRLSLEQAIRQLSPGYRAVFVLHDVEGYDHFQISEILGCAVGTSKSQLHKARMKLRRLLRNKRPAASRAPVFLNWLADAPAK